MSTAAIEITPSIHFERPLRADSPAFARLIALIAEGESVREGERILPFEIVDVIRRSGLLALRVPEEEGGSGVSLRTLLSVAIRIAAADANVAHILRNHFGVSERILRSPRSERNRRWIRAIVDGNLIGLAATELTRQQSGGNKSISTRLAEDGDGYRLTTEKYYSTGSLYSDFVAASVMTDGGRASVLIPTRREGVELVDDWVGVGQRLTGSGTTRFHDVRVEADELIRNEDPDYTRFPYQTLAQLFVTGINAGILQAVLRDGSALVHKRGRAFYHAAAERAPDDPLIQQVVGQISALAFAAEATILAAADALDEVVDISRQGGGSVEEAAHRGAVRSAQAKLVVDELALRATTQLFELGGASSAKRSENLDRHWRNVRTLSAHNPNLFKARALGDFYLNGTPLPNQGFF